MLEHLAVKTLNAMPMGRGVPRPLTKNLIQHYTQALFTPILLASSLTIAPPLAGVLTFFGHQ